ncbi:MAG: transketolase [Candidatus Pacearchaeota archaeon]
MVKLISVKKLKDIANVLRRDSIISTTQAGSGHPTSCMSCAEIISCLFFGHMKYDVKNAQNPENDEFLLSKGHAAPIYYSALNRAGAIKNDLSKLRQLNSPLEGHPVSRDLDWVKASTGSLGQGLSVGLGFAFAGKLEQRKFNTYVLMGDSESSEGSVYEALQLGAFYSLNNLVAIFDVNRLGETRQTMFGHNASKYKKIASSFGWKTEVIDGHDVKSILNALKNAEKSNKPYAIIAKTYKGKGVSFLEDEDDRHGDALGDWEKQKALEEIPSVKMPSIEIKKPESTDSHKKKVRDVEFNKYEKGEMLATRDGYGNILKKIAKANPYSVTVDAELSDSTRSYMFRDVVWHRYIEAFIAEQNMMGMALGLSKKGFVPFASTFAAFHSRAHDQLRMAAHSSANMVCSGSHAGVSIGEDGASQMGLEDIAMYRSLSESSVFYPADAVAAEKLTVEAMDREGISYLRTTRPDTPVIYKNSEKFPPGQFKVLEKSSKDKVVLAGAGITLHEALKAKEKLNEKGINAAVVDIYSIRPFNGREFREFVENHGNRLVVVEDHYRAGGIGELLFSELSDSNASFKHLHVTGIPHSGPGEKLLEKYGIDSIAIVKAAKDLV